MKKYSRIVKCNDKEFRYDYERAVLQWVFDDDEILLSYGLSLENWRDNKQYWCDQFNHEIEEELRFMVGDFQGLL